MNFLPVDKSASVWASSDPNSIVIEMGGKVVAFNLGNSTQQLLKMFREVEILLVTDASENHLHTVSDYLAAGSAIPLMVPSSAPQNDDPLLSKINSVAETVIRMRAHAPGAQPISLFTSYKNGCVDLYVLDNPKTSKPDPKQDKPPSISSSTSYLLVFVPPQKNAVIKRVLFGGDATHGQILNTLKNLKLEFIQKESVTSGDYNIMKHQPSKPGVGKSLTQPRNSISAKPHVPIKGNEKPGAQSKSVIDKKGPKPVTSPAKPHATLTKQAPRPSIPPAKPRAAPPKSVAKPTVPPAKPRVTPSKPTPKSGAPQAKPSAAAPKQAPRTSIPPAKSRMTASKPTPGKNVQPNKPSAPVQEPKPQPVQDVPPQVESEVQKHSAPVETISSLSNTAEDNISTSNNEAAPPAQTLDSEIGNAIEATTNAIAGVTNTTIASLSNLAENILNNAFPSAQILSDSNPVVDPSQPVDLVDDIEPPMRLRRISMDTAAENPAGDNDEALQKEAAPADIEIGKNVETIAAAINDNAEANNAEISSLSKELADLSTQCIETPAVNLGDSAIPNDTTHSIIPSDHSNELTEAPAVIDEQAKLHNTFDSLLGADAVLCGLASSISQNGNELASQEAVPKPAEANLPPQQQKSACLDRHRNSRYKIGDDGLMNKVQWEEADPALEQVLQYIAEESHKIDAGEQLLDANTTASSNAPEATKVHEPTLGPALYFTEFLIAPKMEVIDAKNLSLAFTDFFAKIHAKNLVLESKQIEPSLEIITNVHQDTYEGVRNIYPLEEDCNVNQIRRTNDLLLKETKVNLKTGISNCTTRVVMGDEEVKLNVVKIE